MQPLDEIWKFFLQLFDESHNVLLERSAGILNYLFADHLIKFLKAKAHFFFFFQDFEKIADLLF